MEEWKEVRLDSLVNRKICYGIVQPGFSPKNGIPVIKVNNVVKGLRDVSECDKTTEEISNSYKRTILKGGELIISLVGTVGCIDIAPSSFAGANLVRATGMIDIEDELIKHWVLYYIRTRQGQQYIEENLNTTVQRALNIKDLCKMPIPITSKHYMGRIVSILKSLDDKIEVNRRINDNLEQQAQALFKSWFVDFEPFKDGEFVESELGMIPKGWRVEELENICTIKYGKGLGKNDLTQKGFPVFGGNGIIGFYTQYLYELPQILVSCRGAASGKIIESLPKSYVTSNSLVLELKDRFYYNYLKFLLLSSPLYDYATGSAQPQITIDNIKGVKILLPLQEAIQKMNPTLENIGNIQRTNEQESRRLAELRDTLLPKLMSGELKVNEVEV